MPMQRLGIAGDVRESVADSVTVIPPPNIATDPQCLPILHLHRHHDGYISLAAGSGDDFRPVVAIRASEFETYFPAFREQLLKDSYVSINASWRLRKWGPDGAAHGYPKHDSENMRYLCACYADLDFYRVGLDVPEVLGALVDYQDKRKIPPASIIVRSGRGLWVLWLIHAHSGAKNVPRKSHETQDATSSPPAVLQLETSSPRGVYLGSTSSPPAGAQGAFPEKVRLYLAIQREIHRRLATLGADAFDLARHIRIPGSFSTKSEGVVEWWVPGGFGSLNTYSLDDLAAVFGVNGAMTGPIAGAFRERPASSVAARRRGWEALNARRLREFEVLRMCRGGFQEGHRNRAVLLFAWLLRCNGVTRADAEVELRRLAAQCRPPLGLSRVKDALKTGFGKRMVRVLDQTISDWLDIQPHEAELLERLGPASRYLGADVPATGEAPSVTAGRFPERKKPAERLEAIRSLVAEVGRVPAVREMADLLTARGFPVRRAQVSIDYRILGLSSRRPKAVTQQSQLQLKLPVA